MSDCQGRCCAATPSEFEVLHFYDVNSPTRYQVCTCMIRACCTYKIVFQYWSRNHDAGSCDTLYQVDSSSSDVVIYWTMRGTHVVPDRQHYDGHTRITSCETPSRHDVCLHHTHHAGMIPGVRFHTYQTALSTSVRRLPAHPASALTILERYKLCDHIATTQAAMIRCTR